MVRFRTVKRFELRFDGLGSRSKVRGSDFVGSIGLGCRAYRITRLRARGSLTALSLGSFPILHSQP